MTALPVPPPKPQPPLPKQQVIASQIARWPQQRQVRRSCSANHSCGRKDIVRKLQFTASKPCHKKDEVGLNNHGHSDQ